MIDLSAPRAAVAITADDALILAGRYGAAAIAAGDSGDQATCDALFAQAGRLAKAATVLQAHQPPPDAPVLNVHGFDQHGRHWLPRHLDNGRISVPLWAYELMALRDTYTRAIAEAATQARAARWAALEERRAYLLAQVAEIDPNAASFAHMQDPDGLLCQLNGRC